MNVLDPGHVYELDNLDDPDGEVPRVLLYFVKREGERYPGNVGHHAGTTTQEVMRALIHRLEYVEGQRPHPANERVIQRLRDSIFDLEVRATELSRDQRRMRHCTPHLIEESRVCVTCGHVCCDGRHP